MNKTAMIFTAAMFLSVSVLIIDNGDSYHSNAEAKISFYWNEIDEGELQEDSLFSLFSILGFDKPYIRQFTGAICLLLAWLLYSSGGD